MAEKNNATCSICGNGYHVCHSCKDSIKLQPWKTNCCSVDCYKTYQAVRGFSTGVYTKDEFKSKLQNINLSNLENYRQHIKSLIKDALKEEKVVEDKPIIEAVVEPVIESVVEADVIEEEIVVEKPVYSRKRSIKVEAE
jgi:hypothetical protein